jgi:TRAP transporter 4TM/12TM fusion protein
MDQMFWGSMGVFGTAMDVSFRFIFMFVLFGAFLKFSGFTQFINNAALAIAGWTAGGPAKVAVIGSGLMGMVSGSAVANVVTTGAVTIPLMKRTGYSSKFAGAVEAVASSGGQLAPPVMGAAGFLMAQYLGISYSLVMLAAAIPAILYYVTVFMVVHFESKRIGLTGISRKNLPNLFQVLRSGWYLLIPMAILMYYLIVYNDPMNAALLALLATIVVSWLATGIKFLFSRETGKKFAAFVRKDEYLMTGARIINAIRDGAKSAVSVGIACAVVGIIPGTLNLTGTTVRLGAAVLDLANGSIFLTLLLTMLISIILGMGVPATAAYIIVHIIASSFLKDLGITALAAEMFVFYYASMSNITPPVALASYAAGGLAGAKPSAVGWESMRIGLAGFILPFFFVLNPEILFDSDASIGYYIFIFVTAFIAVFALAGGLQGWLIGKTTLLQRILLLVASFSIFFSDIVVEIVAFFFTIDESLRQVLLNGCNIFGTVLLILTALWQILARGKHTGVDHKTNMLQNM